MRKAPPDPLSAPLERAVTRFADRARGLAGRYRLGQADLDELLQALRIRLWQALGSRENLEGVSASYVQRAAISAALDLLRQRRRRREEPMDGQLVEPESAPAAGPEARLASAELVDELGKAVEALPLPRRTVVRSYLAGHGREEIAELLGWSEAKVRNLLYRGLSDLRIELASRGIRE